MKTLGFTGRSGLKALCALILASQLTGCGSSGGGGSTPSTPPPNGGGSNNPPPPPVVVPDQTVKLKMTGKVTDEPIAFAEVTATVGTETFTATAAADGSYSLDVEVDEDNVNQFVTLSARGVGEQAFVEFKSLAGSFQSLLAQAGDDEELSSTENFSTQITNVSTAQAVFMSEANGGEPITSDAALQSLAGRINAQDVLSLAAAIKLAVDDAVNNPLPAGTTSILALASDSTARQSFVNQVYEKDPAAFAAAQVAIAQDPDLAQPLAAGVIEAYLADEGFTTALLSNDAAFTFNYSGRIAHFDLYADGIGFEQTDTYEQGFTWTIEGSSINVVYSQPVETISYDNATCGDVFAQYEGHYVAEGVKISFLNERTVAITTTSNVTYPTCPELDREETSTVARTVLSMDNFDVIDVEELKGQAQTIYVWDSEQQAVVADVAEIYADGTGKALLTNQDFTWTVEEEGKMINAQFTGWEGDYLSLRDIDELASDLFWDIKVQDGPVLAGAGASVFADPDYAVGDFTAEDVDGTYYQFGVGDEVSGDPLLKGFRLRLDANLMGAQVEDRIEDGAVVTADEMTDAKRGFRWSIEEGEVGREVVIRRTWDTAAQEYNCLFGSANCVLFDERRIIPIVINDDNREYWIEVRRVAPPGGAVSVNTPSTHLMRFYDFEPLSDAAPATGASLKAGRTATASKPRTLLQGSKQN